MKHTDGRIRQFMSTEAAHQNMLIISSQGSETGTTILSMNYTAFHIFFDYIAKAAEGQGKRKEYIP